MSIEDCISRYLTEKSTDSGGDEVATKKILTLPMIYRLEYDINFCYAQWFHPFDVQKWGKVARFLAKSILGEEEILVRYLEPNNPITNDEMRLVHDERFVKNLTGSHQTIVSTSEVWLLYLLPMFVIEKFLITPIRFQTNGTILATFVAMKYGTGINIGGGFHHCSARRPGGFCFIADITLAIRNLWQQLDPKLSILIVDCDAHQGNGYARDVLMMTKQEKKQIYILDLYNPRIYPRDEAAKTIVNREVHLKHRIEDHDYLELLKFHLNATIETDRFQPDLIIFNAGTDILRGDRLGRLSITPNGILKRDEIVFEFARKNQTKIVMLLSGGYQRSNARVIADSLLNLFHNKLVQPID